MSYLRPSFYPVYAPNVNQDCSVIGNQSLLIGGSTIYLTEHEMWPACPTCDTPLVPYIQLNVSSPKTPDELRGLIPSVKSAEDPLMTMLQLFACRQPECFDLATTYSTYTRSWLLRVADVPKDATWTPEDLTLREQRAEARATIVQLDDAFLPARLVQNWVAGKEETLHAEVMWDQNDSEEFYAAHEPRHGLKLLGHTIRGKFFCSEDSCPQPGQHDHLSWRELLQLGSISDDWEEDEALGIMGTAGNLWIEQCALHPEILQLTMSGNW